jgi:anti-sigma B factor antagonist
MSNLDIAISEWEDKLIVKLAGSADMAEANSLRVMLEKSVLDGKYNLILDLEGLRFICSLGLGTMIHLHTLCREHGGVFGLVNPQPQVMKVLRTTRLDELFLIGSTREEIVSGKNAQQGENA